MNLRSFLAVITGLLLSISFVSAQTPTSQPALIEATDKSALVAAVGQDVVVQGVIASAEWSRTGAVMNIEFKGNEQSRMMGVVFQRNKAAFDAAFKGDASKAITGAKVRIKGELEIYSGTVAALKGRPQIILVRADQITIMEPAK